MELLHGCSADACCASCEDDDFIGQRAEELGVELDVDHFGEFD